MAGTAPEAPAAPPLNPLETNWSPTCDRIPIIDFGGSTSADGSVSGASASVEPAVEAPPVNPGDIRLRLLLREAGDLRESSAPGAHARLRAIFGEIISRELPALRQQVKARGYAQSGKGWVGEHDVDDVVQRLCIRALKTFESFNGNEPRQFYAALQTCLRWAVADHVRDGQKNESTPVDPIAGPAGTDGSPGESLLNRIPAPDDASSWAEFLAKLEGVTVLDPRAASVLSMRAAGVSSKEVAETLGISPANVDQIYSRSIRTMRELTEGEPS